MLSIRVPFRLLTGLAMLLALASCTCAQTIEWKAQTYTNCFLGYGSYAIAVDAQQNVYVTGSTFGGLVNKRHTTDIGTVKYDSTGKQLWFVTYDGPGHDNDWGRAIAFDKSGNVYVAGTSWGGIRTQGGSEYDWAILKYDTNGKQQWVRRFNGAANANDYVTALKLDSQGNIVVTGITTMGVHCHITTARWDTNGNLLWSQVFNGFPYGDDQTNGLAIDSHDNILVAGNISEGVYSKGGGGTRWVTLKYSSTGTQQWAYYHGGRARADSSENAIAVDAQDNVYVTGSQADSIDSNKNVLTSYATLKFDSTGHVLWGREYALPGKTTCSANAIAVDASGNVVITGGQGPNTQTSTSEIVTVKYNPKGSPIWVQEDSPTVRASWGTGLVVNASGEVYVAAVAEDSLYNPVPDVLNNPLFYTVKYDTTGKPVWSDLNPDPFTGLIADIESLGLVNAITMDAQGYVYVTGIYVSWLPTDHKGYFSTVKYAP